MIERDARAVKRTCVRNVDVRSLPSIGYLSRTATTSERLQHPNGYPRAGDACQVVVAPAEAVTGEPGCVPILITYHVPP